MPGAHDLRDPKGGEGGGGSGGSGGSDDSKWQRAQLKKLRQVLVLKMESKAGATLDDAQREKLEAEASLRASLRALGCDTSGLDEEARAHHQAAASNKKRKQQQQQQQQQQSENHGGAIEQRKRQFSQASSAGQASRVSGHNKAAGTDRELRFAISQASCPGDVLRSVMESASDGGQGPSADVQVHALFQVAKLAGRKQWSRQRQRHDPEPSDKDWASMPSWHHLIGAVEESAGRLDARQLSKGLWAIAKVAATSSGSGAAGGTEKLHGALQAQVPRVSAQLDGQGCSNIWWAIATCASVAAVSPGGGGGGESWRAAAEENTLHALERSARSLLPRFNSQDLANFVWAAAKLRWQLQEDTLEAVDAAAARLAGDLRPQELSMTLWGLATAGHCPRALLEALPEHLKGREGSLGAQGLPNVLWALAKLGDGAAVSPGLVQGLQAAAAAITPQMTPQGVANTAFAVGRLQAPGAQGVFADMLRPDVLAAMSCHDVGDVLSAAGKLGISREKAPAAERLAKRALQVVNEMGWQALGHLEGAIPALKEGALGFDTGALSASLRRQTEVRVAEVNEAAGEHDSAALEAFRALLGASKGLLEGRRALLVGEPKGSKMAAAVKKACGGTEKPIFWCRFSSGSTKGATEPPMKKKKPISCAVVRVPVSKAALALTLQQLGGCLKPGSPVVLCGHVSEGSGPRGVEATLGPLFELKSEKREAGGATTRGSAGGFAMVAVRTKVPSEFPDQGCLKAGASETKLCLSSAELGGKPAVRLPWTVYPALFAGGELDIMTTFLLRGIPDPPRKARVLDFCCGSGVIAAALLRREPSVKVDALDADSLAVAAAKANLPAASKVLCSDCWRGLDEEEEEGDEAGANDDSEKASKQADKKKRRYHWIVSNPPVHHGAKDDFSVVERLIKGSWGRLRKQGTLWIVAQSYIPLRTLATITAAGDKWTSIEVAAQDGRFQILRCDKGGGAGGEEKAEGTVAAKHGDVKEEKKMKKSKKPKK